MRDHDWSKFIKGIPINADALEIHDVWSTQTGLEKWFLRKAEFTKPDNSVRDRNSHIQEGDTYEWLWHGWSDDTVEKGTLLEANVEIFSNLHSGKQVS